MRIALCAFAFGILGGLSGAEAAVIKINYTGTVTSGFDQTGIFGKAGADLSGDSYEAVYVFDTTLGYVKSSAAENYSEGGSNGGSISPSLANSITVNGKTVSFLGGYYAETYAYEDGSYGLKYDFAEQGFSSSDELSGGQELYNNAVSSSDGIAASNDKPLSYNVPPGMSSGYYVNAVYNNRTEKVVTYTYAYLTPATVTETVPGVPEPSTWALVLMGFAGLSLFSCRKTAMVLQAR